MWYELMYALVTKVLVQDSTARLARAAAGVSTLGLQLDGRRSYTALMGRTGCGQERPQLHFAGSGAAGAWLTCQALHEFKVGSPIAWAPVPLLQFLYHLQLLTETFMHQFMG